jgi:hypothetical protein
MFIDPNPTNFVLKKVHSALHKNFKQFTTQCEKPQEYTKRNFNQP